MAQHKLKITFDDATGVVGMAHRCTVEVAGQAVSHESPIDPPAGVADALKAMLDGNREAMEKAATAVAVQHVAATAKLPAPGAKRLTVGGSLGAAGAAGGKKS